MKLSPRVSRIGESATLRVSRRASELAAQGVEVVDFGAGEPDFGSPQVAVEAARRALAEGQTKYAPSNGTPALRKAVAERLARVYGAPWSAADVVITVGAKAALFELALALFDAGDEVVIPSPCWVSFPEQIRFAGGEPVLFQICADDVFRIRAVALFVAITEFSREVVVMSLSYSNGCV
jgi:aspartate aminotransferase